MQRRDFSKQLGGASLAGVSLAGVSLAFGLGHTSNVLAQGAPVEGQQFVRLNTPAAVTLPTPDKKLEVVEFFWFACPACFAFEPTLQAWSKKLPADIAFRQVPVGFAAPHQFHQKLFYALEEMGQLEAMHAKVFNAIHQQGKRLNSESDVVAFASANGLDGAKLADSMKSFSVSTKANRAKQLAEAYKIDGVPALGINGRFYTTATMAGSYERAIQVAEFLIQRSRQKA
jgi:protein dithiol oxidoreductase (disulfide-forming)